MTSTTTNPPRSYPHASGGVCETPNCTKEAIRGDGHEWWLNHEEWHNDRATATSDTAEVDRTVGIEDAEITVSHTGLIVADLDCRMYRGNAAQALALLDALQANEQQLRDAARVAEQQQKWDDAYRVARDLLGQGVYVSRITPGYAVADTEHGRDYDRPVVEVAVNDPAAVLGLAGTEDGPVRVTRHGYTTTAVEVIPGVIVTASHRDETAEQVPA